MHTRDNFSCTADRQLVLFFGMIATGKSFVAQAWAKRVGCPYFATDRVRKELAGVPLTERRTDGIAGGIYTAEYSRRTYDELIHRAQVAFATPATLRVVLDGSYLAQQERQRVLAAFQERCQVIFIECVCAEEVVRARLQKRATEQGVVSDGRLEIYLHQLQHYTPPTDLPDRCRFLLETDAPLAQLLQRVDGFTRTWNPRFDHRKR